MHKSRCGSNEFTGILSKRPVCAGSFRRSKSDGLSPLGISWNSFDEYPRHDPPLAAEVRPFRGGGWPPLDGILGKRRSKMFSSCWPIAKRSHTLQGGRNSERRTMSDEEIAKIMRWLIKNDLAVTIPLRGPIVFFKPAN